MSKKTTKILVIGDYRARMQNAAVSDDGRVAWIDDTLYQIQTETAQKQAVLESSRARHTDAAAIAAALHIAYADNGDRDPIGVLPTLNDDDETEMPF